MFLSNVCIIIYNYYTHVHTCMRKSSNDIILNGTLQSDLEISWLHWPSSLLVSIMFSVTGSFFMLC